MPVALARRVSPPAALLAAAAIVAGAGCGESEKEAFAEDFRPLSRQIGSLGDFTGRAIEDAAKKTDRQIERQFGQIAAELARLRRELQGLEAPDDLAGRRDTLAKAMRAVEKALRGIEQAAEDGDAPAARRSTLELVRTSEDLANARRALNQAAR